LNPDPKHSLAETLAAMVNKHSLLPITGIYSPKAHQALNELQKRELFSGLIDGMITLRGFENRA